MLSRGWDEDATLQSQGLNSFPFLLLLALSLNCTQGKNLKGHSSNLNSIGRQLENFLQTMDSEEQLHNVVSRCNKLYDYTYDMVA